MTEDPPADWPRAVVFDLDGTLVDSAPDIARALTAAFRPHAVAPIAAADVHRLIGGGAKVAIERAMAMLGLTLAGAELEQAVERFFAAYAEVSAEGNGLFPGAHEVLEHLARRGIALGLCTNKPESITAIALRALGIDHRFGAVAGQRPDLPKKPHPAMLIRVLDGLRAQVEDAVFVGDGPADAEIARAAGCPVVLVDFGYSSVPVAELGVDAIISQLMDLPAAIDRIAMRARLERQSVSNAEPGSG